MGLSEKNRDAVAAIAFIVPSFLGFFFFIVIPIIASIFISFTNYSGGASFEFIGIANYIYAFSSDQFKNSLLVTGIFVIVSVFFQIILGFTFALILNNKLFGRTMFRAIMFLPVILSTIAVSLSFVIIFHPHKGLMNSFLSSIGVPAPLWLASPNTALLTIIIVGIWQSFGYWMVIFLAGLQTIDPQLYEAADIDGAGGWRKLTAITIPILAPVSFVCILMAIIKAFKVFDYIFAMTGGQEGGGPAGSTSVLVFEIYTNAFRFLRMGYASAEAAILFLIILILTFIMFRSEKKWVNYE